jgi:hypothetical protein
MIALILAGTLIDVAFNIVDLQNKRSSFLLLVNHVVEEIPSRRFPGGAEAVLGFWKVIESAVS